MDWSVILDYLLKIIGSIGASVIITLAGVLFAKLKTKIKESRINSYIKEAVQAAEQLYPNQGKKMGKEKYAYVVQQVLAKFPNLTDNEYLKSLIEGAVYTLSEQVKQIAKEQSKIESTKTTTTNVNKTNSITNNTTNTPTLTSF